MRTKTIVAACGKSVEWTRAPVRNSMRKAEFVLPGPGGEVRLVLYRFEGGAGSAVS